MMKQTYFDVDFVLLLLYRISNQISDHKKPRTIPAKLKDRFDPTKKSINFAIRDKLNDKITT